MKAKNVFSAKTRKLFFLLGLLVLSCFSMGNKKLFKFAEDGLPSNLNPIYANTMYMERATEVNFDRLIGWNKDNQPAPQLAVSWKIAPDKKSISLTLRGGVKWHDGKPFTAKDVIFTIKAMTSSKTQITDRYLASIISSVEENGSLGVKISFKKRLSAPLKWLQIKIIPAHKFGNNIRKVRRRNYFNQKPVGTGAYKFHKWKTRNITFKKNKFSWRKKKPHFKKVVLTNIASKNIQVEVLKYGGLDAIIRVRPKDIPIFEKNPNVNLHPYSTNDWWYIGFNHRRSIFRDKKVREAFVYALDRDALRSAHLGDGVTISGPFSPNDPLCNFAVSARNQSLSKAKKLLQAAGWKGKGIRKRRGKKLKVTLAVPKDKASYKALFKDIQSSLLKVGIEVEIKWVDNKKWDQEIVRKKRFDLALSTWNFDELATIFPLFHSRGGQNYVRFRNKKVDKLLKLASKATDPKIYKKYYQELHKLLHQELPYIFLWSLTNYSAVSAQVKNITIHPFNYFHYFHEWKK